MSTLQGHKPTPPGQPKWVHGVYELSLYSLAFCTFDHISLLEYYFLTFEYGFM